MNSATQHTTLGSTIDQMALDLGWDLSAMDCTITGGGTNNIGSITLTNIPPANITLANTPGLWSDEVNPYLYTTTTTAPLHVRGNAEFEGDILIRGISLDERLTAIEQRLNILRPSREYEEKWSKLRELGEQYRALEAELLDKQRVWDTLKN